MTSLYLIHQSLDFLFSGYNKQDKRIRMDLYENWGVGLDSAVNHAVILWNTFVG